LSGYRRRKGVDVLPDLLSGAHTQDNASVRKVCQWKCHRCLGKVTLISGPFIVHQLAVLVSQALLSSPRSGQGDNLGAGEVTVLDLEDTEGSMRLAPFVGG
jgi:hypothetical protein